MREPDSGVAGNMPIYKGRTSRIHTAAMRELHPFERKRQVIRDVLRAAFGAHFF
jgi:hypothetical protein